MPKLFMSYRREDSKHAAGRLVLALSTHFGPDSIYFDVEGRKGVDFVELYMARVAEADVVLAVIGANWNPKRKLDDPKSHVRREMLAAYAAGVPVLPILLDEATIPKPQELPDVLCFLCDLAFERLTHETFDGDAKRIVRTIRELVEVRRHLPALSGALKDQLDAELERVLEVHGRRKVDGLQDSVRLIAEHAVRSELMAIEAQFRARSAAESASTAARRGRRKEAGSHDSEFKQDNGTSIKSAGDGDFHDKNGFCEYLQTNANGSTIEIRGQYRKNHASGFGIRIDTPADGSRSIRFEGEMLDAKRNGMGVSQMGDCSFGEFRDGHLAGPGVYRWASGNRFEGEFRSGEFHGLGVIWSADGSIVKAGRWVDGAYRAL